MSQVSNEDLMERIIELEDTLANVVGLLEKLTAPKKKAKPKVKVTDEKEEELKEWYEIYKKYPRLPQHKTFTQNTRINLVDVVGKYTKEDFVDALECASDSWVQNKLDERWMTAGWILKNIAGFMEGGKYRVKFKKKTEDVVVKVENDIADLNELF